MASLVNDDKTVPSLPSDEPEIPSVEADEVITEEQMPCTVVITGLPVLTPSETTAALTSTFASIGQVQHTIYQQDGTHQHAVVVLDTSEAATAACSMSGCDIMGSSVTIIRAQALQGDDGTSQNGNTDSMFSKSKAATIGVGASAIVLGAQAADSLKSMDERAGISKTVNAAASATTSKVVELDTQLGVSQAVKKTAASASEAVKGIDQKYDISGRTTRAASDASKAATNLANKALENPTVSKGWGFLRGIGRSAMNAANTMVQETNDTINKSKAEAATRRGSVEGTTEGTGAVAVEGESKEGVAMEDPKETL